MLVGRIVVYNAARDLIPLYAVYALLFRDSGLSAAQVSSLFVLWSVTSFALEIPAGALADLVDRRSLLVASGVSYVGAFTAWTVWHTYLGFAAGFMLWGLSSALMSGTFEALLYDELTASGAVGRFAHTLGVASAAALVANLAAELGCSPLIALGGYPLVGWVSVGAACLHTGLACSLPRAATASRANLAVGDEPEASYLDLLRSGTSEAVRVPAVRHVVAVNACLLGLLAYDEYFPLVAREHGARTSVVPLLVSLVVAAQAIGTSVAGRTEHMRGRTMAVVVAAGGVLVSVGAVAHQLVAFVAIAAGYGLLNNAIVVTQARLQVVISGPARATVTSVSGLVSEVVALLVYAGFAVGSTWLSTSALVALLGVPVVALAVAVNRWLPSAPSTTSART